MIKRRIYISLVLFLAAVNVQAQDENIVANQTSGCDSLNVTFSLEDARPLDTYSSVVWNFGDGNTAGNTLTADHTYSEPGIYSVSCLLDGGRLVENIDFISVGSTPYADFVFADSMPADDIFEYDFSSRYFQPIEGIGLSYHWIFPDASDSEDSIATFTFNDEGIYQVSLELSDANGCADTITKRVPISKQLLVPNVFSPNGDEINDYFTITTPGDYKYAFRIFTRDGLQVFYSFSPELSWDGRTIDGREVPEGVYFYLIESSETPISTELSGFVHLFR